MNFQKIAVLSTLILLLFTSCIRDEGENPSPQCDITAVQTAWLDSLPSGLVLGVPTIKQSQPAAVTFFVSETGASIAALNPQFSVSEGATLYYRKNGELRKFVPGEKHDFNLPQIYSVKSQNGQFIKDYRVEFVKPLPIDSCDFESYDYDSDKRNYMVLLQKQEDGSLSSHIWTSGNGGYRMTGMGRKAEAYPTAFLKDSLTGNTAACLVTKTTGFFGRMTRPPMPIAAGNLFIGEFDLSKAMQHPLQATKFGLQIAKGEPKTLSGYYKYTSGKVVKNAESKIVAGVRDTADIYAVLYEVDPQNFVPLYGDDVLTSPRIVMMARIAHPGEPKKWKHFEEPFRLMPGKTFSEARLRNNGYAYTIVMTSSRNGAYFEGAEGSTLWVDNIKTVWK